MGQRNVLPLLTTNLIFLLLSCSVLAHTPVAYRCSEASPWVPDLDTATIDDLQILLTSGDTSSEELVHAHIQRVSEVNQILHAVSEINPDALHIARARDGERRAGKIRGSLHGIPILLKDNIATLDRLNTTAGSFALLGARPQQEASIVKKLRDAGAIIMGKATMGEWAQFRSSLSSSSHGWSAYGGQTVGAYYPHQDPHGSSSGSAVAVSVGLAVAALATETSGSIVNPAEKNNLVGIKPTVGLTSRSMIIPISRRQDSVGPIARTVKDAAYILSAMAGKDQNDNYTLAQPFMSPPDYVQACKHSALQGAKLGIPRASIEYFSTQSTQGILDDFQNAMELLERAGAEIHDNTNFESFDELAFSRNSSIVLDTDFRSGLAEYLSGLRTNPTGVQNLEDLLSYTKNNTYEQYPNHDAYVWERALLRDFDSSSDDSRAAFQANLDMAETQGIAGVLDKYDLDALVMPTFASFQLAAVAGLPIVTVPLGFLPPGTPISMNAQGTMINAAPGIPFGLAFVGRRWSEEKLISLAYAFEQRTHIRKTRKPQILPSFELGDQVIHSQSIPIQHVFDFDANPPEVKTSYEPLTGLHTIMRSLRLLQATFEQFRKSYGTYMGSLTHLNSKAISLIAFS